MKTTSKLAAVLLACAALFAGTNANAAVMTFNGLSGQYGGAHELGPNMVLTDTYLSYTENGFVLTLYGPKALASSELHIGDAGESDTYNWHDSKENGEGAYVVLTAADGGLFNLFDLNYSTDGILTLSANGWGSVDLTGEGALPKDILGVASVVFTSSHAYNLLDDIYATRRILRALRCRNRRRWRWSGWAWRAWRPRGAGKRDAKRPDTPDEPASCGLFLWRQSRRARSPGGRPQQLGCPVTGRTR